MSEIPTPAFEGDENLTWEFVDFPRTDATLDQTLAYTSAAGAMVGAYRLLERIGEGGMGEVWLSEQQHPVRRRVAIKLIKAGMDTREVVARFGSERQALALMNHPVIAKVFDAGSSTQGRPYFVMEYVTGIPITTYCDKHKLTTRERLNLFIQVCDGVQHAHQKAIIHRDLKPSNILVTEVDGKPVPKIIDFGVAKAISQRLTADSMFTKVGAIIGTPEYMSPEQADSAGEDIDTRTDVYSLGVVLYELLVGALPLELQPFPFDEMLRRLREQDTPKPSTKLRTLEQSRTSAQNRRTEIAILRRQVRGDLDAIALKALEKERARRYATPSELALDIGRHLRNEPVTARPASFAYRARKYTRRHRVGVAVVSGLVLLVTCFAVVQAVQLRRTTRERDRADRITAFMTRMFKVSNPSQARGSKVTAREILDKASTDIDRGLVSDPDLQAQMMHVMGTVYWNLGLYSQAESLLRRSLAVRRQSLGNQNPDTLESMNILARVLSDDGRYPAAERLHREALAGRRRALGPEHLDTLSSMSGLANTLGIEGRYAEAERLQRDVLAHLRAALGPEHIETLRAMSNLATTLNLENRYQEAERLHSEALAIERRVLGPDHFETLRSMGNVASDLSNMGRAPEAEKLDRETLDIQMRVLGPEHPDTLRSMSSLAADVATLGSYEEAESLLRRARDIQRRVLGPDHPDTAGSTYNLAVIAARRGQTEQALDLLGESVEHGLDVTTLQAIHDDPDLKPLHGNPKFEALVADANRRMTAAGTAH